MVMAKPNTKPHLLIQSTLLLITCLILSFSSCSSARLLNIPVLINLPADESADLNLRSAGDNVFVGYPLKKESRHVLPCHDHRTESSNSNPSFPMSTTTPKLTGKYGPMILAMLPRGPPLPPSGPGKDINNSNN